MCQQSLSNIGAWSVKTYAYYASSLKAYLMRITVQMQLQLQARWFASISLTHMFRRSHSEMKRRMVS